MLRIDAHRSSWAISARLASNIERTRTVKTFHVEPFNPMISEREASKEGSALVAKQLADMLNRGGRGGWEFDGYHAIQVFVKQGCLGGGPKPVFYHMLVFSRDDQAAAPS
jgi:hypothetical protein